VGPEGQAPGKRSAISGKAAQFRLSDNNVASSIAHISKLFTDKGSTLSLNPLFGKMNSERQEVGQHEHALTNS